MNRALAGTYVCSHVHAIIAHCKFVGIKYLVQTNVCESNLAKLVQHNIYGGQCHKNISIVL